MSIALSRMSVGLPSRTESVDDILARTGHSPAERQLFTRFYKLDRSPTMGPDETLEELLVGVGRQALNGKHADLVLYGHTLLLQELGSRPGFRTRMRAALNLPEVPFFGLSYVACASVLRAVTVARRYLDRTDASTDDTVLILGGDHGSVLDRTRIIPGATVMGDAAVAFLVRRGSGRYRYLGGAARRDPRFHRSMRMNAEEIRLLHAVGPDHLLATVTSALRSADLTLEDIDWILPHLNNGMFWRMFSQLSGVPHDRIWLDLLPRQGHTFGVDALMSLDHADRAGALSPGQRCVLASMGQGAYFQVVVLQVEED